MPPRNRFLDDSQIEKKDKQEVKEQPKPEPQPVVDNKIEDNSTQQSHDTKDQEINQSDVDYQKREYLRIISEYSTPNNQIEIQKQPPTPVFLYSKNIATGEIQIKPKNPTIKENSEESPNIKIDGDLTKQELKKMLEKVELDLVRTNIEIQIHEYLIKNEADGNLNRLYQTKLESFTTDLNYFQKRKAYLELILGGK